MGPGVGVGDESDGGYRVPGLEIDPEKGPSIGAASPGYPYL